MVQSARNRVSDYTMMKSVEKDEERDSVASQHVHASYVGYRHPVTRHIMYQYHRRLVKLPAKNPIQHAHVKVYSFMGLTSAAKCTNQRQFVDSTQVPQTCIDASES